MIVRTKSVLKSILRAWAIVKPFTSINGLSVSVSGPSCYVNRSVVGELAWLVGVPSSTCNTDLTPHTSFELDQDDALLTRDSGRAFFRNVSVVELASKEFRVRFFEPLCPVEACNS